MPPKILLVLFGLLSLGCNNDLTAPGELQGAWAAEFNLPGASLVLNITQVDGSIAGSGAYAMEAGRSGTLRVGGAYAPPAISLTIERDDGLEQTYKGTVLDSQHMTGTLADTSGRAYPLTFTRR